MGDEERPREAGASRGRLVIPSEVEGYALTEVSATTERGSETAMPRTKAGSLEDRAADGWDVADRCGLAADGSPLDRSTAHGSPLTALSSEVRLPRVAPLGG